jgi:hypothetical protein
VTGDASGHIHVATCFPLFQHLRENVLPLDVHVQAHNMTQAVDYGLRVDVYNVSTWIDHTSAKPLRCQTGTACFAPMDCKVEQCDQWTHVDFPLSAVPYSGLRPFYVFPMANWTDGAKQWTTGTWWAYVDNGKPSGPAPVKDPAFLQGEGLFTRPGIDGGKYAQASIPVTEYPWDPTTGQLKPVSGKWTINTTIQGERIRVLVDPALHAHPLNLGTVVHDSTHDGAKYPSATVSIDTTKLSNGMHSLLIAGGRTGKGVVWTGVLKLPFLVANPVTPPLSPTTTLTGTTSTTPGATTTTPTTTSAGTTTAPPPAPTSTTTTTTTSGAYHPACEPKCDQQIANLQDRISRADSILMAP